MCCRRVQLRDDLMTMLIAGHETTAAVLTWTVYCLSQHPQYLQRLQQEVGRATSALTCGIHPGHNLDVDSHPAVTSVTAVR